MTVEQLIPSIIGEMERYFGADQRRRAHALAVLDLARRINHEERADVLVVECAAVLHDIGIHEAERKYDSTAGNYQEIEGPPIAAAIMRRYREISENDAEHICRIIANHHSAKNIDTMEFRVLWDADWLVNIPEEIGLDDREKLRRCISRVFRTYTGAKLAEKLYLAKPENH